MPDADLSLNDLAFPTINLAGPIDYQFYSDFRSQLANVPPEGRVIMTLSTIGGDPEVARLVGVDVRAFSAATGRRVIFLGKAAVYSAGVTIMSFFPRADRYLAKGAWLMVHERRIDKTAPLTGSVTSLMPTVQALTNEMESAKAIQNSEFAALIDGSSVSLDDVIRRAADNWYIEAEDAKGFGLVEGVI